jgi:outer membrane protein TolC
VRAIAAGTAVRAWGMALCESARLQSLSELTQSAQAEFEMLAARRTVGDATEQDVQLAAIELSRHRTLLDEARANLARALGTLEGVTGVSWAELPLDALAVPTDSITRGNNDTAQSPLVRTYRAEADMHQRSLERYERETWSPLNFIVSGGRGDFGEARVGLGLGMNLPVVRRLQGEKAKAAGDRNRALTQAEVAARAMSVRLKAVAMELQSLRAALSELETNTVAAANAAVFAATELRRLGKSDYLAVLLARRELTSLAQRRVELNERQWDLYAEWVQLTGKLR